MSEIFDKLMHECSKFDGNFESSLYLGSIRLVLSKCWSNTFAFLGKISCKIIFFVILKVGINTYYIFKRKKSIRSII